MDRRTFIGAAFSAISFPVMAMTGCSRSQPLRLGIHPWIGYETLYIAREFGWLSPDVVLHEGKIAGDSLVALKQGAVDAAALTLDEVLTARAAGVSLVVVLVFDVSAGADVVLARSDIGELKDIVGRRIGVEPSAVGEIMLARVLEAAGLEQKSVAKIDLPPDRQLEAWRQGLVDVVVTYEPTASLIQREGAVRLFDSRQAPDTIFDVLAVRRDRLKGRERPLADAIGAHFQGLAHLRVNRQDSTYRIAARQGIQPGEVQQAIAGVMLPDLAGNRHYFTSHLQAAAGAVNALMVSSGLLARPDDLADLFDPTYLRIEEAPRP